MPNAFWEISKDELGTKLWHCHINSRGSEHLLCIEWWFLCVKKYWKAGPKTGPSYGTQFWEKVSLLHWLAWLCFGFALLLALACRLWKLEGLQAWRLGGLEARRSPSINSGKIVCKPVPKTSSPYVPSFGGEVQSLHCLGLSIVCSPPLVAPFEWAPGSFATQSQGKATR